MVKKFLRKYFCTEERKFTDVDYLKRHLNDLKSRGREGYAFDTVRMRNQDIPEKEQDIDIKIVPELSAGIRGTIHNTEFSVLVMCDDGYSYYFPVEKVTLEGATFTCKCPSQTAYKNVCTEKSVFIFRGRVLSVSETKELRMLPLDVFNLQNSLKIENK